MIISLFREVHIPMMQTKNRFSTLPVAPQHPNSQVDRNRSMRLVLLTLAVFLFAGVVHAHAQVLYGNLLGTVSDTSGAVVPGAEVIATQVDTGVSIKGSSNGAGEFRIGNLQAGTYELSVKKAGFSSFLQKNVAVAFNTDVRVNAELKVGAESQIVSVSSDAVQLQSDRADVHTNITSQELQDLPQPTRTYETLVGLTPGVNPPTGGFAGAGGTNNPGRSTVVEANGTSNSGTDVRIDGVSAVNPWVQYYSTAVPSTEAIQAVNVVSGTPDAEQALADGATINLEIKSGTNQFHGEVYIFHQDNALKAHPYSFSQAQLNARKPKLIDNDFGGTIGGPFLRNKLFFFASYEGDFTTQQGTTFQTIPTGTSGPNQAPTGERAGDFSHAPGFVTGTNCNDFTQSATALKGCIYDPTQTVVNPATGKATQVAFPNNIIPAGRLNPITQQLVALLPAVNSYNGISDANDYLSTFPNTYTLHKLDTKVTWEATPKLRVSGRYSQYPYNGVQSSTLGDQLGGGNFYKQYGDTFATTLAATYLATPHLLFDASVGFTRAIQNLVPPRANELAGLTTLGIPGTNLGALPAAGGLPQFVISNYSTYGYSYPYLNYTDPVFQYAANGSWSHGTHNVKFGGLVSQQRLNHIENNPTYFGFNGNSTTQYQGNAQLDNDYADFLLGAVSSRQNSQIVDVVALHTWQYSGYARDQWQLRKDLTLSYGVTYEYFPVPTRGGSRAGIERYDFATNTYLICGNANVSNDCGIHVEKNLFDPRLGIAYRPTASTVVRAGYAISREQLNMFRDGLYNYPVRLGYTDNGANPYIPLSYVQQGIPVLAPPAAGVGSIPLSSFPRGLSFQASTDKNFVRGYVESYNVSVQQDLGHGWLFTPAYVGTHTIHQHTRYNTNAGTVLGAGANGQYFYTLPTPTGTNPTLGATASEVVIRPAETMVYNSLQVSLDKKPSQGVQLHLAYTWSHWKAICCDTSGDGGPQIYIPQYFNLNYVASPGDIRHNAAISAIYQLPFGRNKAFLTHGIASAFAGGWQANTVISLHTGQPFNITANSAASLNAPNNTQTPDLIAPLQYLGAGRSPTHQYLSATSFRDVPSGASTGVYRFGTLGLETARAPKFANVDFSLFRTFPIYEKLQTQFRVDALNLFNHANFGAPSANVDGANFGVISSVNAGSHLVAERYFRLGLKIFF